MKRLLLEHRLFIGIAVLAVMVRLYRLDYPLLDWHSWRQVDTASVTTEYVKHGIDLLHPTYHDLSNIPNGRDNTAHGYRMVEFPMINALVAYLFTHQSAVSLVALSRSISILFSLVTLVSLYYLVQALWSKHVAVVAALTFSLLPYSVYYSRAILPEPAVIAFSTLSLALLYAWLHTERWWHYVGAVLALAAALLLKPFAACLAPVYVALVLHRYGWQFWRKMPASVWAGILLLAPLAFTPLLAWRKWISQFPEGIPASDWLFNGNGIRLRPAWFRWLGYERFTKLIWGYAGVLFALTSLPRVTLKKPGSELVFYSWWLAILSYLVIIATGNVQHDYYQVLAVPIISITTALGATNLFGWLRLFLHRRVKLSAMRSLVAAQLITALAFVGMLYGGWRQAGGYFNVNHWEYVRAGAAVDQLTPTEALVIAPAMGDTAFLFQTNRRGWPIGFEIEDKIAHGATHYVTTAYDDEARQLEQQYQTVAKTKDYLILDLTKKITP